MSLREYKMIFIILILVIQDIYCESTTSLQELKLIYESEANYLASAEKTDKQTLESWNQEFRVQQINVSAQHRVQMRRHRDHYMNRRFFNQKLNQCIGLHQSNFNKSDSKYYEHERRCLFAANSGTMEKEQAVLQLKKEVHNWRKGYRYLKDLCSTNNKGNQVAIDSCLVEYMRKDYYDRALERLINLKSEAMKALSQQIQEALDDLDRCLDNTLSNYLETLRTAILVVSKCYKRND